MVLTNLTKAYSSSRSFHARDTVRLGAFLVFMAMTLTSCGGGSSADINYTAIGASETVGVGVTPLTNGFVYLIRDELENKGQQTEVTNLGIPDISIGGVRDVELPLVDRTNPDLITIFVGPNDLIEGTSVASFEDDLDKLLTSLVDDNQAFIVIATVPDFSKAPRFESNPDKDVTKARIDAYNRAILRQAASHAATIADLRNDPVTAAVTSSDGFHPNDLGYQIIAEEFLKVIEPRFIP